MLNLKNYSAFQKEYQQYKSAVDKITIDAARNQGQQLLQQLLNLSTEIERAHDSTVNAYVDPRRARDNIGRLVEVRKQLGRLIKDAGV
jgi:molecular chaperone GrpE (heat shock protein)